MPGESQRAAQHSELPVILWGPRKEFLAELLRHHHPRGIGLRLRQSWKQARASRAVVIGFATTVLDDAEFVAELVKATTNAPSNASIIVITTDDLSRATALLGSGVRQVFQAPTELERLSLWVRTATQNNFEIVITELIAKLSRHPDRSAAITTALRRLRASADPDCPLVPSSLILS